MKSFKKGEYIIRAGKGGLGNSNIDDFILVTDGQLEACGRYLTRERLEELLQDYANGELERALDEASEPRFLLCINDKGKDMLIVANDKFGTNEIYFAQNNGELDISNCIENLLVNGRPNINIYSFYEIVSLFTVMPPRTIYEGIYSVPMSTLITYGYKSDSLHMPFRYWKPEKFFGKKRSNYGEHIEKVREQFLKALEMETDCDFSVALSGGIDSGGILGMLTAITKKTVPSITFGGHGKDTPDLESSRLTAEENNSTNYELYPSLDALRKMPSYVKGFNQPISGEHVFPYCKMFEKASMLGFSKMFFGFGAEMLLGNLKISRVYKRLRWFEKFTPRFLRNVFYRIAGYLFRLSKNQIDFLLSKNWTQRFMLARGPLFTRESHLYKKLPADFKKVIESELDAKIGQSKINQMDKFVLMYLLGWVNYLQLRDHAVMARQFGIVPVSPFDTPAVAEELFRTPDKFRKLNKWSKQVLRDMNRPFVSDRLYNRAVRSLIIPYEKFFDGVEEYFFKYLRQSPLLLEMIDLERFCSEYSNLPQPGLTLMRLISIALWYDTHWNDSGVEKFERACLEAQNARGEQEN
jgi:asparagine synthetase B (glutamine-hydrolysing)